MDSDSWRSGEPCPRHDQRWCYDCNPARRSQPARRYPTLPPTTRVRDGALRGENWQHALGKSLAAWFQAEPPKDFPWRVDPTPWGILVAGFLLQSTTGSQVTEIYSGVIRKFPDPARMSEADPDQLRNMIYRLGLHHRAEQMIACAQSIVDHCHGRVPEAERALLMLPGVGHQRASAVLCFAFSMPEPVIGQTTGRMLRRIIGLDDSAQHNEVRALATPMVPGFHPVEFSYALVDLAGEICRPVDPLCGDCPARPWCARE